MTGSIERLTAALTDRYRIEREIGAGGMATVYLAHDLRHERKVALKVLKPELSAVIGGARFLTEIRTTANLQHPHILPLHDSGEVDGTVFYVMPFVDGESLRDRLSRDKQLPVEDALRIATEVADALQYAHSHGVIHRDIKPENILLHGGHALVADFGIALAASTTGGTRMTETGMSLGTPTYMSPEQAMGERDITARSDVYALGCVLYEMLLGEPPFTGPTAQSIVAKVLSERPSAMRARRDRIPPHVETAVLRALEKMPADRFGTVAQFAAALAAPASTTEPLIASGSRGRWRLAVDRRVIFAAGLLGGLAIAFGLSRRTPAAPMASSASTQLTFNGRATDPGISPDGEFIAYVSQRCALDSEAPCSRSLIVQERRSARPVELVGGATAIGTPRWSADGLSVVFGAQFPDGRSGLHVVPRLGGVMRLLGPLGPFDTHATADSVLVLQRRPNDLIIAQVLSLATGEAGDSVPLGRRAVDGIGWSPDGRLLAIVKDYESLRVIRRDGTLADSLNGTFRASVRWTPDGALTVFRALAVKEDDLQRFDVAADGRLGAPTTLLSRVPVLLRGEFDIARRDGRLVVLQGTMNIDIWTFGLPPSREGLVQRTSGTTWYSAARLSPDGSRLYYQRGDALGDNLHMLTLPDSEEALQEQLTPSGANEVALARDGRRLTFAQNGERGVEWYEYDLTRRVARRLGGDAALGEGRSPQPLPDGGFAVGGIGARAILMLDSSGALKREFMLPDSSALGHFDLSPDGRQLAIGVLGPDGAWLAVTPVEKWEPRPVARIPARGGWQVAWADDGWIYLSSNRVTDGRLVLWRTRPTDARLSEVMTLPVGCVLASVSIATAAPRGACTSRESRGDIWVAELAALRR